MKPAKGVRGAAELGRRAWERMTRGIALVVVAVLTSIGAGVGMEAASGLAESAGRGA